MQLLTPAPYGHQVLKKYHLYMLSSAELRERLKGYEENEEYDEYYEDTYVDYQEKQDADAY